MTLLRYISRLLPDRFVMLLLGALAFAWFVRAPSPLIGILRNVTFAAIFVLFFLHGLRMAKEDVAKALRNWKVQAAIFVMVFVALPVAGFLLVSALGPPLVPQLITGLFFLTILPSTVQSAISFTSLARGNIAASVVAATLINLVAVIVTPLLLALYTLAEGAEFQWSLVRNIALILLLPFVLGLLAQPMLRGWAARQSKLLSGFDRLVILLAVYVGFAASVASGALEVVDRQTLIWIFGICAILLGFAFAGSWGLGRILALEMADRISLLFAGAHKSIATGAAMAAILFPAETGLFMLPLIIYHIGQMIISAPLANKLAARDT
ncbi:MAG: bile acid:sodium symporter [Sphingorhabdus sp.]